MRPPGQHTRRPVQRRHSLAVEAREDLIDVFDDGRDTAYGHCTCPRFTEAHP